MLEEEVIKPVVAFAEANGWIARRIAYRGRRGAPDFLFCKGERYRLVEFKRPNKSLDSHQDREFKRLRERSVRVYLVDNVESGRALFV